MPSNGGSLPAKTPCPTCDGAGSIEMASFGRVECQFCDGTGGLAVVFTDDELDRLLYWLHRPVSPGPDRDIDVRLIHKLEAMRRV